VRRGSLVQLLIIALVAGVISTCIAIFVPWLPTPASRQAGRIWFVYWVATVICLFIFACVAAVLVYCVLNFRAKADDLSDGPPIHGNTALEITWTAVPVVLVTIIAVVSAVVLAKNGNAGPNPLKITSRDVIHSFWVPEMGQKQDAVPGQMNPLVITPDRLGTYPVICTELCGLGHALMRSWAIVMKPVAYNKWYGGAASSAATASPAALFKSNGCSACHTFTAIPGAKGTVGPNLDNLKSYAATAGKPLEAFIKESIVDPNAYIAPGYQPNVMPGNFGSTIPPASLDALVQYLATHAKQ
jgi:cytochrome c oxidase subunit II